MPEKHYKYGGSTAARTLGCPGWRDNMERLGIIAPAVDSPAAREGTALHGIMEQALKVDDGDAELFIEKQLGAKVKVDGHTITIDNGHIELMLDAYDAYLELLEGLLEGDEVDELIEQTLEFADDTGGTPDVIVGTPKHTVVVDWKFGQGIEVYPQDNKQGLFYLMLLDGYEDRCRRFIDNKTLHVAIIQPMPSRQGSTTLKTWAVPEGVLQDFTALHAQALGLATLRAGPWCTFCPAAAVCEEKSGLARTALLWPPGTLEELGRNLTVALEVKKWATEVESTAHAQMELGATVKGWKLVNKRAQRAWIDTAKALRTLTRKLKLPKKLVTSEPTILSPAQMEKVLKAQKISPDALKPLVESKSSGTTLAPENDPREAVLSTSALGDALNRIK